MGFILTVPVNIEGPGRQGVDAFMAGNYDLSLTVLSPIAEGGDSYAQNIVGIIREEQGNISQAIEWYRSAAYQGCPAAQTNLGKALHDDQPELAFQLFSSAATHEMREAWHWLGVMYANGHGVGQDLIQAIGWLHKAASQGNAASQFNLGLIYWGVHGGFKDPDVAIEWLWEAARQGESQAVPFILEAADEGVAEAQNMMGALYFAGKVVQQDGPAGKEMICRAAAQGHTDALFNLGELLRLTGDTEEAARCYHQAAEQGSVHAQEMLGRMYICGMGVPEDMHAALSWLRKAADQGSEQAQQWVAEIEARLQDNSQPDAARSMKMGASHDDDKHILH